MLTLDNAIEFVARITPQWVAGFVDGEGCINARWQKDTHVHSVRLTITQKNPAIIFLLYTVFPGGHISIQNNKLRHGTHTISYHITWHGRRMLPLLEAVKDSVVIKKELVELALEFCKHVTYPGGRSTDIEAMERERLCGLISNINQTSETQMSFEPSLSLSEALSKVTASSSSCGDGKEG